MKNIFALVLFTAAIACHSTKKTYSLPHKNMSSSPVDFRILNNYAVKSSVLLPDSVNHTFIVNAAAFNKTFQMTKASPGTAVVPDFSSQSIVAIILPSTKKVVSIDINKAEMAGNDLHIYYTITDTTSWITYPHIIKTLAAISKNDSLKQVIFFRNDSMEKTILIN